MARKQQRQRLVHRLRCRGKTAIAYSAALLWLLSGAVSNAAITGTVTAHDPSPVIEDSGTFYYYSTGATTGLQTRSSTNLSAWQAGPTELSTPPSWVTTAVPNFGGNLWAPDIEYFDGMYHLYYAASSFGSQVSAIGMATSPTLNPSSPSFAWADQGPVIESTNGSAYNAIDPSVFQDPNGSMWMSFGSFWQGIYLTQLNPTTGQRLNPAVQPTRIARKDTGTDAIEASYLYKRGSYYYLFVNWNNCCMGVNSTYEVRVGRSTSITGPYVDNNGVALTNGGGLQFMDKAGAILGNSAIIGPGQMGIFDDAGTDYFSFHYYDGNNNGVAKFDLLPLYWTSDNWPSAVPALLAGDFNGDGHVNSADISAMEAALSNLSGWEASETAKGLSSTQINGIADVNKDGVINNADLQALLNLLKNGNGSAIGVPEPASWILALAAMLGGWMLRRKAFTDNRGASPAPA